MLDTTCDSTVTMGNVTLTAASDDAIDIDVSENTDGTVTMGNVTVVTGDYTITSITTIVLPSRALILPLPLLVQMIPLS